MEHLLLKFGALGVFIGAAVEGQTAVVIGGLLARQQLMPLWLALGSATAGSAIIDHLLFVAGRRFRSSRLVVRMAGKPAFLKALGFIERYPVSFILAFRFIYGLRAAGPVAIGISSTSTLVFTLLNILSALIWASVFTALGFVFGEAFEEALGRRSLGAPAHGLRRGRADRDCGRLHGDPAHSGAAASPPGRPPRQ